MKKFFTLIFATMLASSMSAQMHGDVNNEEVSSPITVSIGGMMNYENAGVTYQVRKYMDGETQKMDVTVPTYTLDNTVMGNMTLGSYTFSHPQTVEQGFILSCIISTREH